MKKNWVWTFVGIVVHLGIYVALLICGVESWMYDEITFGQFAFGFFVVVHYILVIRVGKLTGARNVLESLGRFLMAGVRTVLFFLVVAEGGLLTLESIIAGFGWIWGELGVGLGALVDLAAAVAGKSKNVDSDDSVFRFGFRLANFLVFGGFLLWRSGIVQKLMGG